VNSQRHILVVDDHATNRKLVATLLGYEGYRVSQAVDGNEGLRIAREDTPDLVISDILMPSMDGYEFVRQLRADPATAGIRVIFYTANYHELEARSLAAQVGVSRVIVKPCPAPTLIATVAEVMADKAPASTAPSEPNFDVEHLRLLTDKLSDSANALRASNSRLAALTRINLQMASEQDPRQMLLRVCAHARALFGARFAVLAVLGKPQTDGAITCVSGMSEERRVCITDPREDHGLLGRTFRERAVHRLVSTDGKALDLGFPAGFPPVRSALAVPVCSLKNSYGWLCLVDKIGAAAFSVEDEKLLAILGAQLGRIYENGSLYREVQEQATQLMIEVEERSRAVEQLQASEERFRELAENIQDVFFVAGPNMRQTTYISPGYERIWGRPVVHMLERDGDWMDTVHPDDHARVQAELAGMVEAFPAPGQCEFRMLRPDGTVRWILTRIFPIVDDQGTVVRTVGVSSDITERKLAELRITRLNRTYAVLSGINSLIVRATDRDSLLQNACHLAVNEGGFKVAWCGLVDEASRELRATASAGSADDIAASVRVNVDEHAAGASPAIDALRSGQPQICNDVADEDARALYREQYLARGFRSLAALPLVIAGKPAGCFLLLTDVAGYFDAEEMRLLVELAGDISFALDHIGKVEQLDYLARFDPLTGLPNRRTFEERISQYIGMASRSGTQFAVVVADPERFEALNNTLGRSVADEVLRQSAARFSGAAGGTDLCGHIGSDQFAAIVPGIDESGISRLLEDLWHNWLGAPFMVGGNAIELTAKAGIALFRTDGMTAEDLLNNAIAALRSAKESSRKVGFYTRDLGERIAERLVLERALRHALENNEYRLHYQPKVDLAGRRIRGLEALIRWQRPDQGLVSPDEFIPVLEETGMIVEAGAWVLRQACLDRKRWLDGGLDNVRIAVNVSAIQLSRDDFVSTVGELVRDGDGDCGLDIEVTESVLMSDLSDNLIKLTAVRDFGVGIALDDFGTGYSSMAYLAKLPVGMLKIDRSFVASMLEDPSVLTLVSTIISLAHSLKLETVAEGVETEEQARLLRLLGCDQMQGYLISKPVPFDAMTVLLKADRG